MFKKTLGGDRLGSGKKMQVELRGYDRSNHDLSYVWTSSASPGTVIPFLSKVALPGDTWDIGLNCEIMTLPTVGPLFGSFKVQLDVFSIPMRLYNSYLHNNKLGIGLQMSKVKIPQIELTAKAETGEPDDLDNAQVNPSCLLSYVGIRGIGYNPNEADKTRQFNAIPILGYWDCIKNYYANKQEGYGAVIHAESVSATVQTITTFEIENQVLAFPVPLKPAIGGAYEVTPGSTVNIEYTFPGTAPDLRQVYIYFSDGQIISVHDYLGGAYNIDSGYIVGTVNTTRWGTLVPQNYGYMQPNQPVSGEPRVVLFDLDNIDEMRELILSYRSESVPFVLNDEATTLAPYRYLWEEAGDVPFILHSQEGLAVKTYQSDLFNNWLNSEYIDYISNVSSVSTTGDSFTMDQFLIAEKLYYLLNRVAVSGGTYFDWIDTVYAEKSARTAETPMYLGGLIKELVFQEVTSNSASTGEPLGTIAGKGRMSGKHKGGKVVIKVKEPSYIMGMFSLTPRIKYSQGNEWDIHLKTFDDLHKPQLDEIGFQDLPTERLAWWDTTNNGTDWVTKVVGKQPAWMEYMTSVDRVFGNFAIQNNQMFMTLNRRYEPDYSTLEPVIIQDLTTYIDPVKYNYVFAQTSLDAQNFWVEIGCDLTVRRKMSAAIMPHL